MHEHLVAPVTCAAIFFPFAVWALVEWVIQRRDER